jgi:DNA-directed RNA polymerase specialized sigma24 family protein
MVYGEGGRAPDPVEVVERREEARRLRAAMLRLERCDPYASVLVKLHYVCGVRLATLARLEGVATATLSQRLAKALRRLREMADVG